MYKRQILDDLSRYGNVSVTEGGDGRIQVKFNGKTVVDSSGNQFTSDELLIGPDGVTLTWNSDNSGMHLAVSYTHLKKIAEQKGYQMSDAKVEKLEHIRSLMDVFKTLPYRRTGVDVKI